MNRRERLDRADLLGVYRKVNAYLHRIEAGAVMVNDRAAAREVRLRVVRQIEALSAIL